MGFDECSNGIDKYAIGIIKYKARRLVGRKGFIQPDREDLNQEMILDLLRRLPKYDPNRAKRSTFIGCVVDHKIATLIEAREAGMRDYRLCRCSLNDLIKEEDDDSDEQKETIDQENYLRVTGRYSPTAIESLDVSIDLGKEIEKLPPKLRALCKRLCFETVTEISHDTGTPRGTIYDSLKKIRTAFEAAGLLDYL